MRKILTPSSFIIPTILLAGIYILIATYLMNSRLVLNTLIGSFSLTYKIDLMFALLSGMWTAMNGTALLVLFLTAILTGANLTLLWQRVHLMKSFDNLHLVVGGNSLLGIVGSGCAACGLPVLSLLGISVSVIYLPFRGAELSYLAVLLLSISFFLLIQSALKQQSCLLPAKRRIV